jgi:glycosyltransferase involved in cell wall biosynthesis
MKIAYLMNTYPITSTTFIRREIEVLEELGLEVVRYAGRRWADQLVDPLDIAECDRTRYLLSGNLKGLMLALAREIAVNPLGLARGILASLTLIRHGGELVRNVAYLLQAVCLRQWSQRDRIRHIHVHFSTNAAAVAMLSRIMGGVGYSFTAHGPDEFLETRRKILDLKLRHAAFAVAITDFCRVQLVLLSGMEHWDKIHVVRCGLKLEDFEPHPEMSADNQTVVCLGRLCTQKGQVLIPKAVAALRNDFPQLKVILIGGGESRDAVEAVVARHEVGDMVELRGWMANDQARRLVRDGRVLLLPSFAEGLPIVIMEALALNRPVISTYIAGIPELVDEACGWIIPAGSEESLEAALRAALQASPEELLAKGREGRARVERLHDLRHSARTLRDRFIEHAGEEQGVRRS